MAYYYEEQGDQEKALELAHSGLKKANGTLSGLVKYLFDHYEKKRETIMLEELKHFCETKKIELEMVYGRLYDYYKSSNDYEAAKNIVVLFGDNATIKQQKAF